MTGEARILAGRRNAEESPGRYSPGTNDLIMQNKANSQMPCRAKQSQFPTPLGQGLRSRRANKANLQGAR